MLEGVARVQASGGPVRELGPEATVRFAAGEWHWHGAAADRPMVHLVLQHAGAEGEEARWGEHVTDPEYAGDLTDDGPIARTELLEALLSDAPAVDRARLSRIDLAPGQAR